MEKSTSGLSANQHERFYDDEILRELCGCLITIAPRNPTMRDGKPPCSTPTVSFAHYTVSEYFDSNRISKSSTAHVIACKHNLRLNFMEITLLEAHNPKRSELCEWDWINPDHCDLLDVINWGFNCYCVVFALLLLWMRQRELSQQDTLCALAIDLLNPSKPHFQILGGAMWQVEIYTYWFTDRNWYAEGQLCDVKWDKRSGETEAANLYNLYFLAESSNDRLPLLEKFLREKDTKDLLRTRLKFSKRIEFVVSDHGYSEVYHFDGYIIEVSAQLAFETRVGFIGFMLLMECGTGLFDPTNILLLFIGCHNHELTSCYEVPCPLVRLLELGANPNMKIHRVTPLQIAVVSWDFEGVTMLLKAGADPNDTGNINGVCWEKGTLMRRFNHLHSVSPLRIHRTFACILQNDIKMKREKDLGKIEAVLLKYGAEEI